jgi:uncharacterized caspase-like protein
MQIAKLLSLTLIALMTIGLSFGSAAPSAGKRVALVIGNGAYRKVDPLTNPENDARLIARTLQETGFELIGGGAQLELDKAGFDRAVHDFGTALQGAEVALFYYSGHGMQVQGENWLVPVDANPTRPQDLDFQMVDAALVLRQMEGAGTKLNLVILDACRNNPFASRGVRGAQAGLAEMRAPEGTLISYATQPGNVASDGANGDSPFTSALANTIRRPGLDIFQVFNQVGLAVKQDTGGAQQPWLASSPIAGNFYFINGPVTVITPPPAASAAPPSINEDALFWQSIAGSKDPADFRAYLKNFPSGRFAELAERRLAMNVAPPEAVKRQALPGLMLGATMTEALPNNRFPYKALQIAREYQHEEVRYLVVNIRDLPEWREFLTVDGCMSSQSYVAFLFRQTILFRASVRFHLDAACRNYDAAIAKLKTLPHAPEIKTFDRSAYGFAIFEFIKPGIASSDGDIW